MPFILIAAVLVSGYAATQKIKDGKKAALPTQQTTIIAIQPITVNDIQPLTVNEVAPVINVDSVNLPDTVIAYAKTLIGTPYLYASTDPAMGFDCSGFITHVFSHFNITVPRSSVNFTNFGREIPREESKPGDLILFTGTDSSVRIVGHMGIVVENSSGNIQFIHSTSGTAYGVVITKLNSYYMGRFVKTIRVFKSLD